MKDYFKIFAFLFLSLNASAQNLESKIKKFIDSTYLANPKAVGFAFHLEAPDQHLSFNYAVGLSNRETGEHLSAEQPVLMASTTKPYVSASILRLMEEGKLDISEPINKYLGAKSVKSLTDAGYHLNQITIKHLLSHTSGIRDYVDEGYFKFIGEHPKHEWTRDEQIARSGRIGGPLTEPGKGFQYADINFVLLTEIIENITKQPYYISMRKLLYYKKLGLKSTRFAKFEKADKNILPQAHQYWDEFGWDTYNLDPSWDLYGGGGMVANVEDMALFFQKLFNGKVIKNKKILALMTQDVPPNLEINYCLGIRKIKYAGLMGYNHGGGLGTDVIYIPELNATVSVASLEASYRPTALEISKEAVRLLQLNKN